MNAECPSCGALVDAEGDATSDCAAMGKPDECVECGECLCDGSC